MIKTSCLSDDLKQKRFSNYIRTESNKEAYQAAYDYVHKFSEVRLQRANGLAYTGKVGTGKTHLLAAIANNLLAKRVPTLFINTPNLLAELLQAQFSDDRSQMEKKIGMVSNAEVVIFDDLAKEKVSEWGQTQYYRIINQRYLEGLPTLFSSNCDWDELAGKLGEATASRLYEMTKGRTVHCTGEDWRMR
jgi:DNA replication protein DnaC